jgi:hypothetical protein
MAKKTKQPEQEFEYKQQLPPQLTPEEVRILYVLAQQATIKVADAIAVVNLLGKCEAIIGPPKK